MTWGRPSWRASRCGWAKRPTTRPTRWNSRCCWGRVAATATCPRALALLEPLARPNAPAPWQALARLLQSRFAEQRRLEEQLDKQNQQLRDQQRRIEQLGSQLEALKAIERSLTTRPAVPAAPAPAASAPPARAMTNTAAGAQVMVVDDDTDMLRLLAMRLSSAGYRVTSVESAEAALAQLALARARSWSSATCSCRASTA